MIFEDESKGKNQDKNAKKTILYFTWFIYLPVLVRCWKGVLNCNGWGDVA